MRGAIVRCLTVGLLILPLLVVATDNLDESGLLESEEASGNLEDEIGGILVDSTISRVGHDFFRYFSHYHRLYYPDSKYSLTLFERPSARWGSLIWIESDHRRVYEKILHPARNNLKETADRVAKSINEKIRVEQLKRLLSDQFDVGADEL